MGASSSGSARRTTGEAVAAWSPARVAATLAGAALGAALLLGGLALAVHDMLAGPSAPDAQPAPVPTTDSPAALLPSGAGPARRDAVAAALMLAVRLTDAKPGVPAAVTGPSLSVPAATSVGPGQVPSGFPRTPEGAVGQLGAITATVLQGMSIPLANEVYRGWALPDRPGIAQWELAGGVQAFLAAAKMGPTKDVSAAVIATPAAGLVKGADGGDGIGGADWVLACVLMRVRATAARSAQVGYGYCDRMLWQDGRWMLGPGATPAKAPSTWPGSELSIQAGWLTWSQPQPQPQPQPQVQPEPGSASQPGSGLGGR